MILDDRFRPTPGAYQTITRVALWALSAIIVTGGAVRLTGSGLGCSDWPNCEPDSIVAPTDFHPMVEFVNRLITGGVSAAVIVAVLGSLRRQPRRADLTRWSAVLVAGVIAQIIIGAVVTLSELKYSVVAVHFLVSMVLVWAACVLVDRAGRPDHLADRPRRWTAPAKALAALGSAVLVSGAIVTSAGPHPGARPDTWGIEEPVQRLPIDFGSVVRVHSVLVWCLCAITVATALAAMGRLGRGGPVADAGTRAAVLRLLLAVFAQGGIGYLQYFTGVPPLLVGFHLAGATIVWILVLRFGFASAVDAGDHARPGAVVDQDGDRAPLVEAPA